jgi:pyridoxal phosphate enzyme (YggS family)
MEKQPGLPGDIRWHMVGHLQTNKVKYIAGFVDMIQSVDSLKLLSVISREALKAGRVIPCLLQIYIAREETKFGFTRDEVLELAGSPEYQSLENIRVCGVMGMATYTKDFEQVRSEFRVLRKIFMELKDGFYSHDDGFREISMGMSGDYLMAIEEGSTMVRLGTVIFGPRTY